MDFHDFPRILGNLGVETDHPPKMCAGLLDAAVLTQRGCDRWKSVEVELNSKTDHKIRKSLHTSNHHLCHREESSA